MEPTTVMIIGFATLALMIAAQSWQINQRVDQRFDQINQRIDRLAEKTVTKEEFDLRFDSLAPLFDSIDHRFATIDHRFDTIDHRFDSLAADVKDNRERLILIQGRLGIGIEVRPPKDLQSGGRHPTDVLEAGPRSTPESAAT